MHIRTAATVLLAALPFSAALAQVHELESSESKWNGKMRSGGALQVKGGLGDIDVVASEGDAMVVEVKRGTEGSVVPRIVVVETGNGAVVCADWTTRTGEPSQCGSSRGLLSAGKPKNYMRADLRIAVPIGTSVDAQVATGNIRVEPLKASVKAKTYEGDIRGTADGPSFYGDNLHGKIEVLISPETQKQKVEADTLNGTVRVVLPETRLVAYEIYTNGAPLYTAYPLEGGPKKRVKGETKEERMYRVITRNNYNGSLGPNGKVWLHLEIHVTINEGRIEIDRP